MIEHCLTSQYIISVAPILGDAIKAYHVDSQSDACGKVAGCDVLEKVQYFDFWRKTHFYGKMQCKTFMIISRDFSLVQHHFWSPRPLERLEGHIALGSCD